MLDARGGSAKTLCERISAAAPQTTVILWDATENLMRVIEPGGRPVRDVGGAGANDLRRELIASQTQHVKE